MTDQFTSLTPAAMRDIIAQIDKSLAIFERHQGSLNVAELQAKNMLAALRERMVDGLLAHPDRDE